MTVETSEQTRALGGQPSALEWLEPKDNQFAVLLNVTRQTILEVVVVASSDFRSKAPCSVQQRDGNNFRTEPDSSLGNEFLMCVLN